MMKNVADIIPEDGIETDPNILTLNEEALLDEEESKDIIGAYQGDRIAAMNGLEDDIASHLGSSFGKRATNPRSKMASKLNDLHLSTHTNEKIDLANPTDLHFENPTTKIRKSLFPQVPLKRDGTPVGLIKREKQQRHNSRLKEPADYLFEKRMRKNDSEGEFESLI